MNRKWLHRGIAASLGVVAALTLMGAKAVSRHNDDLKALENRHAARHKMVALYLSQGDTESAKAWSDLVECQDRIDKEGWSPAELDYLLGVLHQPVDSLVSCRVVAVLTSQYHYGRLAAVQVGRAKAAARWLFQHEDYVVRCYGLALTGVLQDAAARAGVLDLAKHDPNPFVRARAEKTLVMLDKP